MNDLNFLLESYVAFTIFLALATIVVSYWAKMLGRSVMWCVIGCSLFTPVIVALYYLLAGPKEKSK